MALGAFLSHRGVTSPGWVFGVTIASNTLSAAMVYGLARRFGGRFARTAIGRRLLPSDTRATLERKYLRWGLPAIFLCRLVPGIRAVVPPFAGIIGLSPRRALLPIAAASAVWYGFVTVAGVLVGAEWETMTHLLSTVNRILVIAGVVAGVAVAIWLALAARARRQRLRQPLAGSVVDAVLERLRPERGAQ